MKQILFETRNRAQELLKRALEIWRQSDQADYLEDIEKDPVFSLLMMALAYQSNELDSEVERLKAEVLDDFAHMLLPYEMGHATPATAVVEAALLDSIPEMTLGESTPFMLDGQHPFLPLLETRALNASVLSVVRIDGRRWKVKLGFKHPVTDLSLFAFAIKDLPFKDLNVSIKGQQLPLVKPWDYADLPLAPYFALDSLTYNLGQQYSPSSLPMDLFARQNVRLFSVARHNPQRFIPMETESLDLVFEFVGIPEDFAFDKSAIALNPVILVNAQLQEASLSAVSPMVRLTGGQQDNTEKNLTSRQYLHLVRPLDNQIFGHVELEVRGVSGDRFNQGSLVKLINGIITKYRSDFYAFQHLKGNITDNAIIQLEQALSRLQEQGIQDVLRNVSGVYLMPRTHSINKDFSLNVRYLTTAGAALNSALGLGDTFVSPSGFVSESKPLAIPVPGVDELQDNASLDKLLRYYLVTSDRIVTMADIKLFCIKELMSRYGVDSTLIKRMSVHRRLRQDQSGCGYEIVTEIVLLGNAFVKRNFADKIPLAEILLQKMIEVRSSNIYPVWINITVEEQ